MSEPRPQDPAPAAAAAALDPDAPPGNAGWSAEPGFHARRYFWAAGCCLLLSAELIAQQPVTSSAGALLHGAQEALQQFAAQPTLAASTSSWRCWRM